MANAGSAYAALVNVPATQLGSMNRVTPEDLEESYLWHKINATHLGVGGSAHDDAAGRQADGAGPEGLLRLDRGRRAAVSAQVT
jgi:hypothetical protein